MKTQYKALLLDTIQKEVRSKTLIFIFLATTLVILLSHVGVRMMSSEMTGSNINLMGENILTVIFRILNTLIFLIAIIFGVNTVRSDFQNNIIQQYLSFPLSRTEYLFIRVLGSWLLVLGYYIYAYVFSTILYSVTFNTMIFGAHHFFSFLIMSVYILMLIFISILFSLFMNKIGALITVIVVAQLSGMAFRQFGLMSIQDIVADLNTFKGIGLTLYMFFPRIEFLSELSSQILSKNLSKWEMQQLFTHSIHLVVTSGVYITLADFIIKKKNF